MNAILQLIRNIGGNTRYKGYYYLAEAIKMELEKKEPNRHLKITKEVYPKIARRNHSKAVNVEHDIRTLIKHCWETNPEEIEKIAGYPLDYKPSNLEMIDILAFYLRNQTSE